MARLIRFEEHDSGRRGTAPDAENHGIESEAADWDEAGQMVRHYLQLAETALKKEEPMPMPVRKRRRA